MADILDGEQLKRKLLSDMRVELTEEFDKNFGRKAFFTDKWKKRANPNAKGSLRYIEPQADNSIGSGYEWEDLSYLANMGATKNHECRGIMRIDNKLFNIDFIEIFDK